MDVVLDLREGHFQQLLAADAELVSGIEPLVRFARNMHEVQAYRFVRITRVAIAPEIDRIVELDHAVE